MSRIDIMAAQSAVEATAAKLLNFAEPLDVTLLDSTVNAFYASSSNDEVLGVAPHCSIIHPPLHMQGHQHPAGSGWRWGALCCRPCGIYDVHCVPGAFGGTSTGL